MYVIFPADEVVYLSYGRLIYVPKAQGDSSQPETLPTATPHTQPAQENSPNPSVPSTSTSSSKSFHAVTSAPILSSHSEDLHLRRGGVETLQSSVKSNQSWPQPSTSQPKTQAATRPPRQKKKPPPLKIIEPAVDKGFDFLQLPFRKSKSKSPSLEKQSSDTTKVSKNTKNLVRENTPVNSDRAKKEWEFTSEQYRPLHNSKGNKGFILKTESRLQSTSPQQLTPEKLSPVKKNFFGSLRGRRTAAKMAGVDSPLRDLTHPSYNEALKAHNAVTFKLVRTVSDFTQQLGQIYEQQAEELQLLVSNFKKKNLELRKERPACPSSLFHVWETLLQEVEIDSQALGDIASILGRQISRPLLERSFFRKIQARKVFSHRESYETIVTKTEEKLAKCRQEYKAAYLAYLSTPTTESLSGYFNNHNAYVQQLHATNGMLDAYSKETLPQLLQEIDEIYTDLCSSVSEAILQEAEIVSARATERHRRYENLISQCRAISATSDMAHLARSMPTAQGRGLSAKRPFIAPQPQPPDALDGGDPCEIINDNVPPPLKDQLVIDRLSAVQVQPAHDALKKESADLDAQIRQIQDSLETLLRIQQRSLESALYNKVNEIQEDISMKRFDLRVAQMHLSAINSQKELFLNKLESSDSTRERKMSLVSTGSMKNKWLKAFKSLKTPPPSASPKETEKKNGSASNREVPRSDPDAHVFQEYTYKKITPCDICSQILRGHTRQGLKCRYCKMNVHVDCQDKAPKCQPKSRLLRRQKSTSEIESRVAESTVEEENRRRGYIERVQGPSTADSTSMRRRLFAGMKSLTGFGSRSRHGSPGHRSISLPEKRGSQDASGTRPFGEPLCLLSVTEQENGRDKLPTPPSPSPSKGKNSLKKGTKYKK
uniref:Phorbol-ester/DAG-type domain-containing protein n=2 Tax=Photinus pyralis TaxID=7054 RepID=A0A1Y1K8I5_PHOPY